MFCDIRKTFEYLGIKCCYICKEIHWREIRTEAIENPQDNTVLYTIECICQMCGARERKEIEFSRLLLGKQNVPVQNS
jgi:hypothetical protein